MNFYQLVLVIAISFTAKMGVAQSSSYLHHKNKSTKEPSLFSRYLSYNVGYQLSLPIKQMKQGMNAVHSFQIGGAVPLHFISPNIEAGIQLSYGWYALKSYGIHYTFGNNIINTSIDYSSTMLQAGTMVNYYFNRKKRLQPFIGIQAGYTGLLSNFYIEDPRDPAACIALEQEEIQSDGTLYFGYGGGVRFHLKGAESRLKSFLELNGNLLHGGNVSYINANQINHHSQPLSISNGNAVQVRFRNPATNDVHNHTVAEVYNNPLRMLQLKLSYVTHFRLKN